MLTNTIQNNRRASPVKVAKNWHERIKNSVAWVTCILAIVYQSYQVVDRYLKYETTSQVEIFRPNYITVPKLYIGFSGNELSHANKTYDDDLYYTDRLFYDFYYSPSIDDAFKTCVTGEAKSDKQKECTRSQLGKSSKNGHVYYSASIDAAEAFPRIWAWGDNSLYNIIFTEQSSNISNIKVILQACSENPHGSDVIVYDYLSLDPEYLLVAFHYTHLQQHLLPSPYDSHCLMYEKIGFDSQAHCLEQCINAGYLVNMNKTSSRSFWAEEDLMNRGVRAPVWFNCTGDRSDEETFQMECESQLQYYCSKNCSKPDCFKEVFVPIVETYSESETWNVYLLPPKMQSERTRRVPRMDFVDCLSELLAIYSFWIGFSAFTLIQWTIPEAATA